MQIGELAKISGVAAHTIRFYESKGLLPKPNRKVNGYRRYGEDTLQSLAVIKCAKRLGFSLDSISEVLLNRNQAERLDHDKVLEQLDMRLNEVDVLISRLQTQLEEITAFNQQLLDNWKQGKCLHEDASVA